MLIYYDFEGKRMHATVTWMENEGTIEVQLTDKRLRNFPGDLLFDISRTNKVTYVDEDPHNKRLCNLQMVVGRRLQEFANQGTPKQSS